MDWVPTRASIVSVATTGELLRCHHANRCSSVLVHVGQLFQIIDFDALIDFYGMVACSGPSSTLVHPCGHNPRPRCHLVVSSAGLVWLTSSTAATTASVTRQCRLKPVAIECPFQVIVQIVTVEGRSDTLNDGVVLFSSALKTQVELDMKFA